MRRIGFQSFSLLRSNWNGVGRNRKFSNQQSKSTSTSSSQIKNAKSPDLPTMTMITDYKSISERMKTYEEISGSEILDSKKPFIVRLDGSKFSTFTRDFNKPFDPLIASTMIATASDLLTKFSPSAVYTASDEISLVFGPTPTTQEPDGNKNPEMNYGGKVFKVVSLTAGYASARFTHHCQVLAKKLRTEETQTQTQTQTQKSEKQMKKNPIERLESGEAFFDGRAFNLPNENECVTNLRWRIYDCIRNSISLSTHSQFSNSEVISMNSAQLLDKLKTKNIDWFDYPHHYRYGILLKKKKVPKKAIDFRTKQEVEILRAEIGFIDASLLLQTNTASLEDVCKMVMEKNVLQATNPKFYEQLKKVSEIKL